MSWEDLRLAIGEFLTSAGFAGLTAIAAAAIAYRGIVERGRIDKSLATAADDRARWWEALMWVWANRDQLPSPVKVSPPAVDSDPPIIGWGTLFCQAIFPVVRSIAENSPY